MAIATAIAFAFVLSVSCEVSIDAANARSDAARAEIAKARSAVELAVRMSRQEEQLERSITMLHLHDTSPQQCAVVISQVEYLGARNGLRVMGVLRDVPPVVAQSGGSQSDIYEVTFYGAYRNALSALAQFADLPLVANIKSVTFDRLRSERIEGGDVRTSIQLEVFRMVESDAARTS